MTPQQRYKSPTPEFFRRVSKCGIALAAVGGALLTTPIALPAILVVYLTITRAVAPR